MGRLAPPHLEPARSMTWSWIGAVRSTAVEAGPKTSAAHRVSPSLGQSKHKIPLRRGTWMGVCPARKATGWSHRRPRDQGSEWVLVDARAPHEGVNRDQPRGLGAARVERTVTPPAESNWRSRVVRGGSEIMARGAVGASTWLEWLPAGRNRWTRPAAGQPVRRKPVNMPRVPDAAEGRLPVMKAWSPST